MAEVGRAPFDLIEAESEIVAGFNIEYSGLKFGMFFVGEFLHAFTVGVLTAVLAWLVFREHFDARIAVGMGFITVGAFVLAWQPHQGLALDRSAALVAAACLAWAVDNNLTRRISGGDAILIAALKGAVAGVVNLVIAAAAGARWPIPSVALIASLRPPKPMRE